MSLESLNALKQLVDTRQSGANVQNDNLEKVQGAVQQQGTSEAARVDNLHLEKIKANYETLLSAAHVERLQAQLQRETRAVTVATVIAIGSSVLAAGDFLWNTIKDAGGHQNLNDSGSKAVQDMKDPTKAKLIKNNDNDGTSSSKNYLVGEGKGGGETVYMAHKAGDGSIKSVGAATITKDDIQEKLGAKNGIVDANQAIKMGLVGPNGQLSAGAIKAGATLSPDGSVNVSKVDSFEKLNQISPKMATDLFKSKEHDIKLSEAGGFLDAAKGARGIQTLGSRVADGALIGGAVGSVPGAVIGAGIALAIGEKEDPFVKSIETKLRADGKYSSFSEKAGNVAKSTLNGVIQLAETVVPYFQALLAAKDKAQNTAEELQMAQDKYAAAMKKLKSLENLIVNAGDGGMGAA